MTTEQMNLLDVQGRTPLHECAENIHGVLARYLIRHGADENAKDIRGNTILHLTAEKGIVKISIITVYHDFVCWSEVSSRLSWIVFMFIDERLPQATWKVTI
jgi:hypothetical protein